MREAIFEGKSEEDALLKASEQFGVNIGEMTWEVIEETSSLFGLFGRGVKVRVRVPDGPAPIVYRPGMEPKPDQPKVVRHYEYDPDDDLPPLISPPREALREPHREPRREPPREPQRDSRPPADSRGNQDNRGTRDHRDTRDRNPPPGTRDPRPPRNDARPPRPEPRRDVRPPVEPAAPPAPVEPRPRPTTPIVKGPEALAALQGLFHHMDFQADVTMTEDDDQVLLNVKSDEMPAIIGRDGEVLAALQFVVNKMVNRFAESRKLVVLDAEGFRDKREDELGDLARTMGEKAVQLGKVVRLSPMNAQDRRLVPRALKEKPGITTHSEGEGSFRCLLIVPDGIKGRTDGPERPDRGDQPRHHSGRGGRGGGRGGRGPRPDRGPAPTA